MYDQNYMRYEKKVRSDEISNSVRLMSDKTLEYFDSTAVDQG